MEETRNGIKGKKIKVSFVMRSHQLVLVSNIIFSQLLLLAGELLRNNLFGVSQTTNNLVKDDYVKKGVS